MTISRAIVLRELRDLAIFLAISVVQTLFMCPRCNKFSNYVLVALFSFSMWIALYKGNGYLTDFVNAKISWIQYPVKRLVVGIVTTVGYTLAVLILLMSAFERIGFNFGNGYHSTIYVTIVFTILVSLVLHSRAFLQHWQKAQRDADRYQRESIQAQYESLKNQVNPHFLFNSFNALTNLVYEDQEKAVKFIKQLSEVYRYVLDSRDKEIVPLEDELKFLEAYLYLQRIRFGDKLDIRFENLEGLRSRVAPLALQMLLENAIKHNIVSEEDPLHIRVYAEGHYIIVTNNLQRKSVLGEPSAGVGLDNIVKRYSFLSEHPVQVIDDGQQFRVQLPILPLES